MEEEQSCEEERNSAVMLTEATSNLYEPIAPSNEEIQEAIQKMLKSKKSPKTELWEPMQAYINTRLPMAVDEQKYKEAKDLENASKLLMQFMDPKSGYFRECQKRADEDEKYKQTKRRLRQVMKEWDAALKLQEEQKAARIKELENRQKQECAEFQNEWSNPEYIIPFQKPSAALIQLKDRQKSFAKAKLFDQAEDARKRAAALEKREVAAGRMKAIAAMKLQFENMQERHDKEMECLMIKERKEIEKVQHDREVAIRPIQIQIAKMEDEIEYRRKNRIRPSDYARQVQTRPIRTKKSFKDEEEKEMLNLGGLNAEKLVKARKRKVNQYM